MKYKYVKIAGIEQVAAPLIGAAVEGTAEAAALSQIKNILSGDTGKDIGEEIISHFKDKAKQEQFQGAENATNMGNLITTLKNDYMSSGFSSKEFDSYFPEFFNLENPFKVTKNPVASNMDTKTILEIMQQARDDASKSQLPLRKVFETELMLYAKTRNLALVKNISGRAVALESQVTGLGILESIFDAIGGDVSQTGLMMALLGTPELMREYTDIVAQATGHKLAPAELIIKDAEISKSILNNQIIANGLAKGIQNAIESVNVRQQQAAALKTLNNLFQNTTSFTGLFRNVYYLLWTGDNLAVDTSSAFIPSNAPLKQSLFNAQASSNSKFRKVYAAVSTPLSAAQMEAELKRLFSASLTNTQRVFNQYYQIDARNLIDTIHKMRIAKDMGDARTYAALRPKVDEVLKKRNFRNDYNQDFCNTASSYVQLMDSNMPVTNNSVEQTESMAAPETIETLAPSKELAEKMKPVQQRYNEALETYQNIKGSIYGEPGSNMMAGNAKELGQTKLVPYKSPQQVREKINSAQESITYALDLNRQLANIFEGWINLSASEPNKVNRLKFNVRKLNSEFEKLKADRFELKSEAITVEETMKQRNERFMGGGELAAQLSGLAASSKGTAYGLAGGVSQLNRLMDNQIVMQDQKIAKIQAALSSAESDEEMMALEGQLKHAKIEKELLQNKIFQQTNDALQGKFDPSFYTDAMSSPLVTKTSKTKSKFVLASKYIKESDTEIEDYYNNLYENSEDSPEYGTALEHPKETRYTLTVDIPKHKHKKSSKYNLN
jgi:hypothetical protein